MKDHMKHSKMSYPMSRLALIVVFVVALVAAVAANAAEPRRISHNESGSYEAFPDVCRLADGELVAVFYAGYGHISLPRPGSSKDGRICIMRSQDDGRTWSKPQTLVDLQGDDRDPSIMQTSKGTLICNFMTFYGRAEVPVSFIVRVIRSTDGGKTWSEPTVVPSPFKTVTATSSPAIELTDGTLLLPIYGRDTPSRYNEDKPGLRDRSVVLRSADDGKTWDAPVFIDDAPEVHLQEPSLLQLDDGRLLCVMRRQGRQSFSEDGGLTWSKPEPFAHRADCPYLLQTQDGLLLCATRSGGTSVTVSTDRARSWSKPMSIDRGPGAYPSMVELDNGRILCLYYVEERPGSRIRQAVFRVNGETITCESSTLLQ